MYKTLSRQRAWVFEEMGHRPPGLGRESQVDLEENPKSTASSITATTTAFHIGPPNTPPQWW